MSVNSSDLSSFHISIFLVHERTSTHAYTLKDVQTYTASQARILCVRGKTASRRITPNHSASVTRNDRSNVQTKDCITLHVTLRVPLLVSVRGLRKPQQFVGMVGIRAEIRSRDLPNTKHEC
jgi:hypothetical protein